MPTSSLLEPAELGRLSSVVPFPLSPEPSLRIRILRSRTWFRKRRLRLIRVATIELAILLSGTVTWVNARLGLRSYFLDLSFLRYFLDDACGDR